LACHGTHEDFFEVYYLEQDDTEDQEPVTRSEQVDVVLVPELKGLDPDSDLGNVDVVFVVFDICLDDLRGHELRERYQSAAVSFQVGGVDKVDSPQTLKSSEPM
jgi:hypothetical protein